MYTIAFYNLENLFDTIDDPHTMDDEFTPKGMRKWTNRRYKKKLIKLAKTIAEIGTESKIDPPVIIGIAEIENEGVVNDLLNEAPLDKIDYGYEHYDSPDERGMDTGFLYHKKHFKVIKSEPITLHLIDDNGKRDTTRDILYVHGKLNGEEVHIFVNHWPSRRYGQNETEHKRIKAAQTIRDFMLEIEKTHKNPNYIVMGDFNDDPSSASVQLLMESGVLYNPMEKLHAPEERGSTSHRKNWSLFDQILVSHNFLNYEKGTHSFAHANIFDDTFLTEYKGKFKGSPYRTYAGKKYLGGYSDHFPVYIELKYNE